MSAIFWLFIFWCMLVIPGQICPREKLSLSVRFPLTRTKFVKEIPLTFPLVLMEKLREK